MDNTTNEIKTYRVPEENLATLRARFEKLTRKCNRAKIEAPVMTVGAFEDIVYEENTGDFDPYTGKAIVVTKFRRVYSVSLASNGRPKINGYEFAAVISPVTDEQGAQIGNVLRHVPGFDKAELPATLRDAQNYCDHCKTSRRRLETFVIWSETTGFRQIGRNCLANYLGLTDPDRLCSIAEMLINAADLLGMAEDEGFGGGGYRVERIALDDLLATGAAAIRLYGWLSGKAAREFDKQSTAALVRSWVFAGPTARKQFEHQIIPNEADKALAAATLDWMGTLSLMSENDYLYTLALLAKSVSVEPKNFGFAVSAIAAYSREKEFEIRRNKRIESDSKSEFMGTVGKRAKFENATVEFTTTFETEYGTTTMYKMRVGENVVVYFGQNLYWNQGDVVSFEAFVKNHERRVDKYNPEGMNQTMVNRVKTFEEIEEAAKAKAAKKVADKAAKEFAKFFRTIAWG